MVETTTAPTNKCNDCGSTELYGVAHTELDVSSGQVERPRFREIEWVHLWCESCGADIIYDGEEV